MRHWITVSESLLSPRPSASHTFFTYRVCVTSVFWLFLRLCWRSITSVQFLRPTTCGTTWTWTTSSVWPSAEDPRDSSTMRSCSRAACWGQRSKRLLIINWCLLLMTVKVLTVFVFVSRQVAVFHGGCRHRLRGVPEGEEGRVDEGGSDAGSRAEPTLQRPLGARGRLADLRTARSLWVSVREHFLLQSDMSQTDFTALFVLHRRAEVRQHLQHLPGQEDQLHCGGPAARPPAAPTDQRRRRRQLGASQEPAADGRQPIMSERRRNATQHLLFSRE